MVDNKHLANTPVVRGGNSCSDTSFVSITTWSFIAGWWPTITWRRCTVTWRWSIIIWRRHTMTWRWSIVTWWWRIITWRWSTISGGWCIVPWGRCSVAWWRFSIAWRGGIIACGRGTIAWLSAIACWWGRRITSFVWLGTWTNFLFKSLWYFFIHLSWYLDAFLNRNCFANLLWNLLTYINWVLCAHSPGKFPAFFPGNIYWDILALLIRNILALGSWNLFFHFLGNLLALLFWNLAFSVLVLLEKWINYLLTLLVVTISMALLLISCGTLLLILQISHTLIDHITLLLIGYTALLLTLSVKHCPALGLCELIALLLISNILQQNYFFNQNFHLSCLPISWGVGKEHFLHTLSHFRSLFVCII